MTNNSHVTCSFCLGMFKRERYYLHHKICRKNNIKNNKEKRVVKNTLQLLPPEESHSSLIKHIFPVFRHDNISLLAKSDKLIIDFGSRFYENHKGIGKETQTTQKMRDLALFLERMKDNDETIKNLEDCLNPDKFLTVIDVVQSLACYDKETGKVGIISISSRLKYSLQQCAELVHTNAIISKVLRNHEKELIKSKLNDFIDLIKRNWRYHISSNSEKSRMKEKLRKPNIIPDNEDVVKLFEYTEKGLIKQTEILQKDTTVTDYVKLQKYLIAQIIVLNRRRPKEVVIAELKDYLQYQGQTKERDVFAKEILTEEQQKSMNELSLFYVLGKRNRDVPCLLTHYMRALDILITTREDVGISANEILLFPQPDSKKPYNGSKILSDFKEKCKLKNAKFLTCTGLRHEAATLIQLNRDGKNSVSKENMANHLRHDLHIHEQNYKLPLACIERGEIGHS